VDLTAELTLAARRAEAKQALDAVLAQFDLPPADRKAILLDLAMAPPAATGPATKHSAAPVAQAAVVAPRAAKRGRPHKRRNGSATHGAVAGRTDTLIATLSTRPGMPIVDLASTVYGDSSDTSRAKTRSLLAALKNQGRVRSVAAGQWEVVPQKS
jgi:hypothetical protein